MRRRLMLLSLIAVAGVTAAVLLVSAASPGADLALAEDGGPEMELVVISGGSCESSTCQLELGAEFVLAVEIVKGPAVGYILAQSLVDYGSDLVYKPMEAAVDEIVWLDCEPAVALRAQPSEGLIEHGCLTGLGPPHPASMYAGNFVEMTFTCSAAPSSTEVRLVPKGDIIELINGGTTFASPDGTNIAAKVGDLTVQCGTDVGQPTVTPSETTAEPLLLGDANCDGVVDSVDALLILQTELFALIDLPCAGRSDVNGDGQSDSLDALLVLQFSAGLIQALD